MRDRVAVLGAVLGAALSAALSAQTTTTVLDSVILAESPEDYLVWPRAVAPDGTGGYLVTDVRQARVLHFAGDGRFLQSYGREGEGPGEFRRADVALPSGDDHVLILSSDPLVAQLFERNSGQYVERFPLLESPQSALLDSRELWTSGPHYPTESAVRRLELGIAEPEPIVELPDEYTRDGPVGGMFGGMPFVKWADTLMVGFQPLPYVIVANTAGAVLDRFEVPVADRRGAPASPDRLIEEALQSGPYFHVFAILSSTLGVHRRTDGSFLVVHFDYSGDEPPFNAEVFVTVIDADRTQACPDRRILLGDESAPAIGFEGDTVLVLEHLLRGTGVVAVLRRIAIETDDCDWVQLGR